MGATYAKEKLFHSIDCKNLGDIRYILNRFPNLSNDFLDKDQTCLPLTRAAWIGSAEVLKLLIEFGGDVNKATCNGQTPLYFAIQKGRTDAVQFLVASGSEIEVADSLGYTPLDFAVIWGYYNLAQFFYKRVG